jgi:hypothetical protein
MNKSAFPMNEQIAKLYMQAAEIAQKDQPTDLIAAQIVHTLRLAELVVRECLNKIENEAAQYAEPVWAIELVNDIKQHFGIEE